VNPELHAIVRRYSSTVILTLSIFALVVGAVSRGPYAFALFLLCGAAAAGLMILAAIRSSAVQDEFSKDEIIDFAFDPHPINSLFGALERHVKLSSVQTIKMMSSDINKSRTYYHHGDGGADRKTLIEYLAADCPRADVVVFGPAENGHVPEDDSRIRYVLTQGPLITHKNLIILEDESAYVWYEPFHRIVASKHFFTAGAYLVKVGSSTKELLEAELDRLGRNPHSLN
jgi:hypothetical protein